MNRLCQLNPHQCEDQNDQNRHVLSHPHETQIHQHLKGLSHKDHRDVDLHNRRGISQREDKIQDQDQKEPEIPQSKRPKSQRPQQVSSRNQEDTKAKEVLPLNDEERKNQKNQRNSLLKQLSKNRGDQRQSGSRNSRPKQIEKVPVTKRPQKQETKTGSSALENLFSIISSNDNAASQTVVKVTSSSSSSSSSSESSGPNVRIRPHGKKQGKRKSSNPTPTEDPSLQNLTPQERLVKKVQETLRSGENKEADRARPKSRRKKVIFRKKKTDDDQLPRSGRTLGSEGTQIKTVKVRVRRIVEPQPFPIVY